MKILMIASYLPFPLFSGGQVRLFNLIKEISVRHEITLICEKRDNQTKEDISELEKICKKVIVVDRRKQWSFNNIFKSLISSHSFLLTGHTSYEMAKKIKHELETDKFDLIHVETYYVMQNVPSVSIPIVLAEHNIEYYVYKKYADNAHFFLRSFLEFDIWKIKKEEEGYWKKAERVIAVSESDAKVMEKRGLKPIIVANGVDIEKFQFRQKGKSKKEKAKKILFMGDFKWIQNRDSAKFIITDIWPRIKNQESGERIKLWIVGRNIPQEIISLIQDPNIIFDEKGSARATEDLFGEADVLLAPIRVGGGTSYKILESMSCGTPVVTTPLSADALNAQDQVNIMVGENAQELAEKTVKLLTDAKPYESIAKNARSLIEKKYTWKKIANELETVYASVIASE